MNHSQGRSSGPRKKKLTERFQQYLEQEGDTSNKRRYVPRTSNKNDNEEDEDGISMLDHQRNLDQQNSNSIAISKGITVEENNQESRSLSSKSSTTAGRKVRGPRIYTCHNCGFVDTTSSTVKAFIKNHHQQPENYECYTNGLVHCPNTSCQRVVLTEKDMELHCSMTRNSSKNPCLNAFNELKAIENDCIHHNSTEVNAARSLSHGKDSLAYVFYPNLLGTSHIAVTGDFVANQPAEVGGYYNSQSHYYNIMQSHFNHKEGTNWLIAYHEGEKHTTHTEGDVYDEQSFLRDESNIEDASFHVDDDHSSQQDEEDNIIPIDHEHNEEIRNAEEDVPPVHASYSLSAIQEELEYASRNMTFSNEFNTCYELETC
jgi:hypothetical protein